LTANRLARQWDERAAVTVVDRDDRHVYQPGLLFVPFDLADPGKLVRSRRAQLRDGIEFRCAEVDRIETAEDKVHLQGGEAIPYDVLVVATGTTLLPEETEGLTGPGGRAGCPRSTPLRVRLHCGMPCVRSTVGGSSST
jgi:sulfide:quinone oxidoreductase